MKRSLLALPILLVLAILAQAESPSPETIARKSGPKGSAKEVAYKPWPHEGSDLKPDPSAIWGNLENGLRFVIVPNKEPPGRVSLRLSMDVGSLMEEDDQQGVAHFVEHMAFNGMANFPPQQTLEYFQRLGMSFGAHTNALTSFRSTTYQLELPKASSEYVNDGLRFFRDVVDGMMFESGETEQERGVILSEMRDRNTAELRSIVAQLAEALPDTRLPRRMPIGIEKTIRGVSRERIKEFYETWYTPRRATIVAVGDIDVLMIRALIERNFSSIRAKRGECPDPDFGRIVSRGLHARLVSDQELSSTTVSLNIERPAPNIGNSIAEERKKLIKHLMNSMLNTRFKAIASAPDAPFQDASATTTEVAGIVDETSAYAVTDAAHWEAAIAKMEQEIRRARLFSFGEGEFKTASDSLVAALKYEDTKAETRSSENIANSLINSLSEETVFAHPSQDRALYESLLKDVTRQDCQAMLRELWESEEMCVLLSGNLKLEGDSAEKIMAAYSSSRGIDVYPADDKATNTFAYTQFGAPGTIQTKTEQTDLGIVQAVLSNQVRVNIKRTDFKKNTVEMSVRIGGGKLQAPREKPGLDTIASSTLIAGGLKAHDMAELNRVLADKQWSLAFSITDDAFQFSGQSSTADLETALQVATAYVVEPGFRAEAIRNFHSQLDGLYAYLDHTPEGMITSAADHFIHGNDPRFGIPSRDVLQQRTMDEVRAWLEPIFQSGYMEVAIVGDIEPDAALQLVARTFGAIPEREAQKPAFSQERRVSLPANVPSREFKFTSDTPRAALLVFWPAADGSDIRQIRRIRILSQVLLDRLRVQVREDLGAAYTPNVLHEASEAFPGYGYLVTVLFLDPSQLEEIGPLVKKIGENLATSVISDDEFQRAMAPELAELKETGRNNTYWLGVLRNCQERPSSLEGARSRETDYMSITKADVVDMAKRYLAPENAMILNLLSEAGTQ
jgi:zinc protease